MQYAHMYMHVYIYIFKQYSKLHCTYQHGLYIAQRVTNSQKWVYGF